MNVGLTELERHNLRGFLTILLEAGEPEVFLACLRRIAERKAHSFTRGMIDADECKRWLMIAEALTKVEREVRVLNVQN